MPVKLRLKKQGRRKHPHYAIVAADSRAPRDGRFIEKVGFYDPVAEPGKVFINHDAAIKWLQVGAQPTNTVRSLLRHAGVTLKFALIKQGKSEDEIERIYGKWRTEKDGKAKKKVISVDIHGRPLEPVPNSGKPVKKKVEAVVEEVKETAAAVAETTTEVVEEVKEEVAEATEAVAETVEEVVEEVKEEVAEAAEAVAETAEEVVEEVKEEVAEATEAVAETTEEVVEEVKEEVAEAVEEATEEKSE